MNKKLAWLLFRIYFPGDANDEGGNGNNINDGDETIDENDEVEGDASNLDYSSDEEVWREWLEANGGSPYVDDSIDEQVGEEAGENGVGETLDDDEVEAAASNMGYYSHGVVWREMLEYILSNCVSEHDESYVDPHSGDSMNEEELFERIEYLANQCVNVERGASNSDYSSDAHLEVLREWLDGNDIGPNVDDSIDGQVGEEAGVHVVEEANDGEDVANRVNEESQVRVGASNVEQESEHHVEEAFDDNHVNYYVNVEGDASRLDVLRLVELMRESIQRVWSNVDSNSEYSNNNNFEMVSARKQQIDALATFVVSQEQLGQLSEDFCSICFGEFELDQEIKHPPCTHIFHTECLRTWLEKDRRCPYCRMSCIA